MREAHAKFLEFAIAGKNVSGEGDVTIKFGRGVNDTGETRGGNELLFHTSYLATRGCVSARQLFRRRDHDDRVFAEFSPSRIPSLERNGVHHVVAQVEVQTL